MKKSLLCLALLLIMAFPFAACQKNFESDLGEKGYTNYVAPDFGEKSYREYLYEGLSRKNHNEAPDEALIKSVKELNEFRKAAQLQESVFFGEGYTGSHETKYTKITSQLDSYTSEYFKENDLIVIFRGTASGSYEYTVKDVETEGNTVNVTLQLWRPAGGTCDVQLWGILIECKKSDFSELNVVTEIKDHKPKVIGTGFFMGFTHEATIETIYKDYTTADFPELDFEFTIREMFEKGRDEVRQTLKEGSTDKGKQEYAERFSRMFEIKLAEKSEENVLRAVELLTKRKEVSYVEPFYEYYFEID